MHVKVGGAWKNVSSAWVKVAGAWKQVYPPYANFSNTATGTYTSGGISYKYVRFTSSATLTITETGFVDALIVSGGARGWTAAWNGMGGSYIYGSQWLSAGSYTITIGAPGTRNGVAEAARGNPSGIGTLYSHYSAIGNQTIWGSFTGTYWPGPYFDITGTNTEYSRGAFNSTRANSGDGESQGGGGAASGVVIVRVRV